jgi:hypothetical protein
MDKYADGFHSGLERTIAKKLKNRGVAVKYEERDVEYLVPKALDGFVFQFQLENGILIQTIGRSVQEDRKRLRLIKEQHPELDIRLVFTNANSRLSDGGEVTCAMWADSMGFKWAEVSIPDSWIYERKSSLLIK